MTKKFNDYIFSDVEEAPNENVEYDINIIDLKNEILELRKTLNQVIEYNNYLVENINQSMRYSEYLANSLDNLISYQDLKFDDEYKKFSTMKTEGKNDDELKKFLTRMKNLKIVEKMLEEDDNE